MTAPPGYQIERGDFSAPPGTFDSGTELACPAGTVVWGGGVENDFDTDTINTSALYGTAAWQARVNNVAGSTEGVEIDAVCAQQPKSYMSVSTQVDDPAGTQTGGSATCPKGTVLLSGSVISEGDTTAEYLTSAWPTSSRQFKAVQENASSSDQPFQVTALCARKPAGYAIVKTTQTAGLVEPEPNCPSGSSVFGGGVRVATPEPSIIISISNVGDGSTTAWLSVVDNTTVTPTRVTGYTICAA